MNTGGHRMKFQKQTSTGGPPHEFSKKTKNAPHEFSNKSKNAPHENSKNEYRGPLHEMSTKNRAQGATA